DGPIGLEVTATAFARAGDPFVFVRFEIENTSGDALAGLYPGIFADWDLSFTLLDLACLDEATQLLYAWDPAMSNPYNYGQMAIDTPSMDVDVTGTDYHALPGDDVLYDGLTSLQP